MKKFVETLKQTGRAIRAMNLPNKLTLLRVARVPLYLLDTNMDSNSPADRQLTARLYSNDPEVRISQEILLGIGQLRLNGVDAGQPAVVLLLRERAIAHAGVDFGAQGLQLQHAFIAVAPFLQ